MCAKGPVDRTPRSLGSNRDLANQSERMVGSECDAPEHPDAKNTDLELVVHNWIIMWPPRPSLSLAPARWSPALQKGKVLFRPPLFVSINSQIRGLTEMPHGRGGNNSCLSVYPYE